MKRDEELLAELRRASEGLFYMSESEYPFEVIRLEGKNDLSPQYLRQIAGGGADDPLETRSVEEFFRVDASEAEWKRLEGSAFAQGYPYLVRLLKENLSELRVYKVGRINIPVFILGKSAEGNWIGLSTRAVET